MTTGGAERVRRVGPGRPKEDFMKKVISVILVLSIFLTSISSVDVNAVAVPALAGVMPSAVGASLAGTAYSSGYVYGSRAAIEGDVSILDGIIQLGELQGSDVALIKNHRDSILDGSILNNTEVADVAERAAAVLGSWYEVNYADMFSFDEAMIIAAQSGYTFENEVEQHFFESLIDAYNTVVYSGAEVEYVEEEDEGGTFTIDYQDLVEINRVAAENVGGCTFFDAYVNGIKYKKGVFAENCVDFEALKSLYPELRFLNGTYRRSFITSLEKADLIFCIAEDSDGNVHYSNLNERVTLAEMYSNSYTLHVMNTSFSGISSISFPVTVSVDVNINKSIPWTVRDYNGLFVHSGEAPSFFTGIDVSRYAFFVLPTSDLSSAFISTLGRNIESIGVAFTDEEALEIVAPNTVVEKFVDSVCIENGINPIEANPPVSFTCGEAIQDAGVIVGGLPVAKEGEDSDTLPWVTVPAVPAANVGEIDTTITGELDTSLPKFDVETPAVITDKFPFSIPFDVYNIVNLLSAEPKAPVFNIPFESEDLGIDYTMEIDLSEYDWIANIVRWILYIIFLVGLAIKTNSLIGRGS